MKYPQITDFNYSRLKQRWGWKVYINSVIVKDIRVYTNMLEEGAYDPGLLFNHYSCFT